MPLGNTPSTTVLIVDDVPDNVAMLHDALDEAGYTVLVALDGESALRRARQALPDVVLLDAVMPGMDGFEVARQLKADPAIAGAVIQQQAVLGIKVAAQQNPLEGRIGATLQLADRLGWRLPAGLLTGQQGALFVRPLQLPAAQSQQQRQHYQHHQRGQQARTKGPHGRPPNITIWLAILLCITPPQESRHAQSGDRHLAVSHRGQSVQRPVLFG